MVVTDLKMRVSDVPDRVVLGESLPLSVSFFSEGVEVTRRSFLERLRVYAGWADGSSPMQPLNDRGEGGDAVADDARLDVALVAGTAAGRAQLRVLADGLSFVRDRTVDLEVLTPGSLAVSGGETGTRVGVAMTADLVVADRTDVEAWVETRGKRRPLELQRIDASRWEATVDGHVAGDTVHALMRGETSSGHAFEYWPPPLSPTGGTPLPERAPPEAEREPEVPAVSAPPVLPTPQEPTDWVLVGLVLGVANVVLLAAGLLASRWLGGRRQAPVRLEPAPVTGGSA
jgi:hypothetical protein